MNRERGVVNEERERKYLLSSHLARLQLSLTLSLPLFILTDSLSPSSLSLSLLFSLLSLTRAPRFCNGAQLLPPAFGLKLINAKLGASSIENAEHNKLVLVARSGNSRGFSNEADVVRELRRVAENAGLELVVFRGAAESMQETINLFAEAKVVVGAHGGGLANIVFSKPGTVVVEIGMKETEFAEYSYMSQVLGFAHANYVLDGASMFEAKWTVMAKEFARFVKDCMSA